MLKFTEKVKKQWIKALKSGKYKQGFITLHNQKDDTFCCLGVLGDIHPKLSNASSSNPYSFLKDNNIDVEYLWKTNDNPEYRKKCFNGKQKRDYSNVIPLIESLPTVN